MANKRYDQFTSTAPTLSRITLTADASTGTLGKCTVQDVLNLQQSSVDVIAAMQTVGSPIKTTVYNCNPLIFGGSGAPNYQAILWAFMYVPAGTYTGIWYILSLVGNFSILGYNGFALYSQSGGTLTRVAICTTDITRWKSGSTGFGQAPFTSAYTATAAVYWLAFLYTGGAASPPPQLISTPSTYPNIINTYSMSNSLAPFMTQGGQTAMPSSIAASSLGSGFLGFPMSGLY